MEAKCVIQRNGTVAVALEFDDHDPAERGLRERLEAQGATYELRREMSYLRVTASGSISKTGLSFNVLPTNNPAKVDTKA